MSYIGSPYSNLYGQDEYEFDDHYEEDDDRENEEPDDSDEGKWMKIRYIHTFSISIIHMTRQ